MPQGSRHFATYPRPFSEGRSRPAHQGAEEAGIASTPQEKSSLPDYGAEEFRVLTANAVTAILAHCEAIKRRTDPAELQVAEIHSSLAHIAKSARRIWNEVGQNRHADA